MKPWPMNRYVFVLHELHSSDMKEASQPSSRWFFTSDWETLSDHRFWYLTGMPSDILSEHLTSCFFATDGWASSAGEGLSAPFECGGRAGQYNFNHQEKKKRLFSSSILAKRFHGGAEVTFLTSLVAREGDRTLFISS